MEFPYVFTQATPPAVENWLGDPGGCTVGEVYFKASRN